MSGGRKIIETITPKQYNDASSTLVKDLMKNQQTTDKWLSEPVIKIIEENRLLSIMDKKLIQIRRFIPTGTSGGGKTSVIRELEKLGHAVIHEVGD